MMGKNRLIWLVPALLACVSALALIDDTHTLKLEPAPKELHLREGSFHLGPKTKIYVQLGHQSEDRIAAETLAEEVADRTGLQLEILGMKPEAKAQEGAIVLARLDDKWVRKFLARNGLQADQSVGEEGYILYSDDEHLIVAANSGQGLFYGVQTLRQLLRSTGKGLICPAVGIRDWPTPETFRVEQEVKRPSPTQLVKSPWRVPGS
jgi:hexosaminidase